MRGPKPVPAFERFWRFVEKGDGCWEWTGSSVPYGYGSFGADGTKRAHRISWEIHFGPIPNGLCVLHHCDNPPCVNPAHLFLGTRQDNSDDKMAKGRGGQPKGIRHPRAKMTDESVMEMRRLYAAGHTTRQLAQEFGLGKSSVWLACTRQTWAHVA
jgi:hypothetical protein